MRRTMSLMLAASLLLTLSDHLDLFAKHVRDLRYTLQSLK